jgi:hypothetical protein
LHALSEAHRHRLSGIRVGGARLGDRHRRRRAPARLEPGGLAKTYCGFCGAHLFARDADTGVISIVRLAAIDGDPGVRPLARQFVAYHPAWAEIPDDGLPRFDEALPRPSP